jgi:hypothetical protein
VACGIELFAEHWPRLKLLSSTSGSSSFFSGKESWFNQVQQTFTKWRAVHAFPMEVEQEFHSFMLQQWDKHYAAVQTQQRLTWSDVQFARKTLGSKFVCYCEDHHPNHVMIFCPKLYYGAILHTWNDVQVFKQLSGTAEQWQQHSLRSIPAGLRQRYPWGFKANAPLPRGTVFLKRKKQFSSGRTIISYSGSLLSKLLAAASLAITAILNSLWPGAVGQQSSPIIWKQLHSFFECTPPEVELVEWNDDLIGFF